MWYTGTNEYCSALKRKGTLKKQTNINLEDIMLRERNQTRKIKFCRFYLYKRPRIVKFINTESRMMVLRGRGKWAIIV